MAVAAVRVPIGSPFEAVVVAPAPEHLVEAPGEQHPPGRQLEISPACVRAAAS